MLKKFIIAVGAFLIVVLSLGAVKTAQIKKMMSAPHETPAASVSGLYFAHPEARYFSLGRIGRDQVVDYARRKGMTVAEVERWLAPVLAYEPEDSMALAR